MHQKGPVTPNTTAQIFNIIRQNGEINRMGITEISGVSKSTISHQINKLLKLGLIEEISWADSSQRKLKLKIRGKVGCVAGIFLGTTKLSIVVFSLDMEIVADESYRLESISEPEAANKEIISRLSRLCEKHNIAQLWGIGIGFPFPVNFREGKPDSPPNVPLWHDYPLKTLYENAFSCPVLIDNDVNVMALGEGYMGCTREEDNFLFIKAGTGIGAGLILDGRIYRGAKGCAGDIGHIAIDGSSRLCHCGNRGCLEAVTGGKALAVKAEEKALSGESPFLAARLKSKIKLDAVDINDGAIAGDLTSIQLIKEAGHAIGEVTAKLVNFFNPSSIIVGGGLAGFGNHFISAIRESVIQRSPHLATYDLNVCISELKDKSGPVGAGTLILDHIFSPSEFPNTIERV